MAVPRLLGRRYAPRNLVNSQWKPNIQCKPRFALAFSKWTCARGNSASRGSRSSFRSNPCRSCRFCWKIWPSDTFVDFDHGLYNGIKRLREALGDSADTPHYIETLARRGYRFIGRLDPGPTSALSPIRSLAVLPLENLSRDPEQEYFAEGLTEALITTLAKIGELRVVSRTSIMQYKRVHKPLREIAGELEVEAIVEGTVLRSGHRVRITAQLIDAPKETHLWAESYERDLRKVLALQSEVAQAIAREVQVKLTPVDRAHFAEVPTVEPDAYEAYLKGRYHWNRRSAEGLRKAIQNFQLAIVKDPTYPAAHAG